MFEVICLISVCGRFLVLALFVVIISVINCVDSDSGRPAYLDESDESGWWST
jgi:hypothetical protein